MNVVSISGIRHPSSAMQPMHRGADPFERIIGTSASVRRVVDRARLLAAVDVPVLLQGETGVGKEVFARAIHDAGPDPRRAFVAINCGSLSRELLASELFGYVDGAFTGARRGGMIGKIEAANGGTLFLDEIGEMPLELQPYLLRLLESGEIYPLGATKPRAVRFRLLTATNRDLRAEVAAGRFRMDLFYRVAVTSLEIPPLRRRKEDIPALVSQMSDDLAERRGVRPKRFAPEVLIALACHTWPGNIRELRNVIEAMLLLSAGDVVDASALPTELGEPVDAQSDADDDPSSVGLDAVERTAVGVAIRVHAGNLTRAAKELRISKSTLYAKIEKYGLDTILDDVRLAAR